MKDCKQCNAGFSKRLFNQEKYIKAALEPKSLMSGAHKTDRGIVKTRFKGAKNV